jgi:DNA-binding NtrC family response regulator
MKPTLCGERILLVEDDVILLMDLEQLLQDVGAEIVARCRTVHDGLAAARDANATVAIVDVRIGRETIAPVVRQLHARGIPFVLYTGQTRSEPVLAEWRGVPVVSKPASAGAIISAVVAASLRRPFLKPVEPPGQRIEN